MRAVRHDFARRRRRSVRLVKPAALATTGLSIPESERVPLIAGLTFAAHLRRLFPAFYEQHAARLRTNPYNLLGVMAAFLSLVHTELLALDLHANADTPGGGFGYGGLARIVFAPKEPSKAFYQNVGMATAARLLAIDGKAWLHQPVPKVYGVGVDEVTHRGPGHWDVRHIDKHSLALLVWRMLGETAWQILPAERVSEIAQQQCVAEDVGQHIAVVPTIPAGTPLTALCAHLDRREPDGIKQLGTLIAYLCGRTGNGYADVTPAETRQQYDMVVDLDWERPREAFAEQRALQQRAGSYARLYSRLSGRFTREQDLLPRIRGAILEGVASVADAGYTDTFGTYDPAALYWRTWP